MRFAAATTALLVAHHVHGTLGASTESSTSASTPGPFANNHGTTTTATLRAGGNQLHNHPGNQHQQFPQNQRNPKRNKRTVGRLLRNLAKKKKNQETMTIQNTNVHQENNDNNINDKHSSVAAHGNHRSLLDLGILGWKHSRLLPDTSDAAGNKEPIFDQNSVRDPQRETGNVVEDAASLANSTSSPSISANEQQQVIPVAAEESNFLIPALQYLCQIGNCDCNDFDFESTQGSLECSTEAVEPGGLCASTWNYCGESVELCYRETISLEATGPQDYSYTTCVTYTQPYQQHVCLTFDSSSWDDNNIDTISDVLVNKNSISEVVKNSQSSSPCFVQFNNQECNSCSTAIQIYERTFEDQVSGESHILSSYQSRCFQIDCSNAAGRDHVINTCDTSERGTIRENLVFGDDCTKCPPCGVGFRMTDGTAIGTFPLIGSYECYGLELGAMVGFFDRDVCGELQSKATEYCGCEAIFFDPSLVLPEQPSSGKSGQEPNQEEPGREEPRFDNRTVNETENGRETEDENLFLLPGDTMGAASCHLCGANSATIAKPNNLVELPNGRTTTCSALEGAGRLGMMTSNYCKVVAMPLAFNACGGCSQWGKKEGEEAVGRAGVLYHGDESSATQRVSANHALSRLQSSSTNVDDYDDDTIRNALENTEEYSHPSPRLYREDPEEIDVVSPEVNATSEPVVSPASPVSAIITESSGSLNTITVSSIIMIPISLLVYFL
mmetsp:Transcript_1827/g.3987  ORF Transcript_1827/g.3987 Transcript_1827/m.3987 type:complete len:727 (+) Transcript_1827:129-2309(+)